MEERRSDTEETFGSQEPAEDVSNQNAEEAPGGGSSDRKGSEGSEGSGSSSGAGDQSQATGHPRNAG